MPGAGVDHTSLWAVMTRVAGIVAVLLVQTMPWAKFVNQSGSSPVMVIGVVARLGVAEIVQ